MQAVASGAAGDVHFDDGRDHLVVDSIPVISEWFPQVSEYTTTPHLLTTLLVILELAPSHTTVDAVQAELLASMPAATMTCLAPLPSLVPLVLPPTVDAVPTGVLASMPTATLVAEPQPPPQAPQTALRRPCQPWLRRRRLAPVHLQPTLTTTRRGLRWEDALVELRVPLRALYAFYGERGLRARGFPLWAVEGIRTMTLPEDVA